MKMFSSQEQPISTPAPLSLDDQWVKAQNEYDSALAKQRELEADFQQQSSSTWHELGQPKAGL